MFCRPFSSFADILLLTFPFYVFPHNHTCSFSFF
jgi:hypothetical protein